MDVVARVRAFRQHMGWSYTELAKQANLSDSVTRGLDTQDWSPSFGSLKRLEEIIPDEFPGSGNIPNMPH